MDAGGNETGSGPCQAAQQRQVLEDMKKVLWQQHRKANGLWTAAAAMVVGLADASAQLAITEVMSSAAITSNGAPVQQQSDWWELTNFGPDPIDLTDYYWTDNQDTPLVYSFQGLEIGAGKSVIFFRAGSTPDERRFREWWSGCLGTNHNSLPGWALLPG